MFTHSNGPRIPLLAAFLLAALALVLTPGAAAQTATTTTLAVTGSGSTVTSVSSGTVVTLTATVIAGSVPVTPGQVAFCDASATYCTDIHQLAVAQLMTNGTAIYKFRPGAGTHSYKAVFLGTQIYKKSSSAASSLAVSGPVPSTTTIIPSGTVGDWTLTATVSGPSTSGSSSPTGNVSFIDTSNSNAVLATESLSPATPGLSFVNKVTLPSGLVADFNQDGIPDVTGEKTLLGNGDGTFTEVPNSGVLGTAVADFNNDGFPDVASPGGWTNIGIDLGNGNGTFTGVLPGPQACDDSEQMLGCNITFVATGDFNGDGNADIVYIDGGYEFLATYIVSVMLGVGDGTFNGGNDVEDTADFGTTPVFVAVGDFNGDGFQDMAIAHQGGNVTVFLSRGDGRFTAAAALTPGNSPSSIAVADLNGDGILDLAVTNYASNDVSIFLGKGDGTFIPISPTFPAGTNPWAITPIDFNGDGIPDLAVGDTTGYLSILLGKGDGTFTALPNYFGPGPAGSIEAADFNGDGIPDLNFGGAVLLTQYGPMSTASAPGISLQTGTHTIVASYAGDTNFNPSSSGVISLTAPPPAMVSPTPGSTFTGSTVTFQWSKGTGPNLFLLTVGVKRAGSSDIYGTGVTTATSATVSGLPTNGATVYVQLRYYLNGVWSYFDYTYTAETLAPPALVTPTPGSQLPGSNVTFQWTPGSGVTQYLINVGTRWPGSDDLYGSGVTTKTSATVAGLPTDGATIYVLLRYEVNGVWTDLYYTYTASGSLTPPALTTPAPGSHLTSPTATFQWSPGSGPSAYLLTVGTKWPGSSDIYGTGVTTATSANVSGLPTNGVNVYVQLRYQYNGVWTVLNYTYTADGTAAPPVMISPAPGSVLSGSSVTFQWTPGTGVTTYALSAGTYGPGYFNLYSSPQLSTTSGTVPNLPTNGKPVYINLRYQINGVWQQTSYTYTAVTPPPQPGFLTPPPGSTLTGPGATFTWTLGIYETQVWWVSVQVTDANFDQLYSQTTFNDPGGVSVGDLPTDGQPVYVYVQWLTVDGSGNGAISATYTSVNWSQSQKKVTPSP